MTLEVTKALRCPPNLSPEDKLKWHGWSVTNSGCWEWTGPRHKQGYGCVRIGTKTRRSHRVAYAVWIGELEDDLDVLHHCDNPPCINPAHLYKGTDADNARDMKNRGRYRKGRTYHGESHSNAKLSDRDVELLVQEYRQGGTSQSKLAAKYGVSQALIWGILNGTRRTKNA